MPCTYDPSPEEIAAATQQRDKYLRTELDRLTKENDRLRELVVGLAEGRTPSKKELDFIYRDQIKHRKEDLKRLEKTFRSRKDAKRLGLVMLADPNKPLADQLGFDPDSF